MKILALIIIVLIICYVIGCHLAKNEKVCQNVVVDSTLSSQIHQYSSTGSVPDGYYNKIGQNNTFDSQIYNAACICKKNLLSNIHQGRKTGKVYEILVGEFLYSALPDIHAKSNENVVRFHENIKVDFENFYDVTGGRMLCSPRLNETSNLHLGKVSSRRYNYMQYANEGTLLEVERSFNAYGFSVKFSGFKIEKGNYCHMMYVYAYVK